MGGSIIHERIHVKWLTFILAFTIYDDPKYNAAFDRCIDVMTKLMLKYGKQVLEQHQTAAPVSLQKQPDTKQISSFADAA